MTPPVGTEAEAAQAEAEAFVADLLSGSDGPPQKVTTHISKVFIGDETVLKLKRAVKFPFLDFTTLSLRKAACEAEIAINRRFAPDIYERAVPITREADGVLALDGNGPVIEWLVQMRRFDPESTFDKLAARPDGLRRRDVEALADEIARVHAEAPVVEGRGGHAGIRKIAENNREAFRRLAGQGLDDDKAMALTETTLTRIDDAETVLDARRARGRVRQCHGDMHLRNICMQDGRPTLFDAIEFSAEFSEIDVMYDLAFLLMDLDFYGLRRLASMLVNRYLDVGDEAAEVFRVLPIFLSMRAQIRAHVGAAGASDMATANRYLDAAATYLQPVPARLVAVGGLSGSGKSRLARELAPFLGRAPGARVVRTDVVRKRLLGVHPNERLGAEGYSCEITAKTYAAFIDGARAAIEAGQSVILDAVFAGADQREAARSLAAELGVPFQGIWVDAPDAIRIRRVEERKHNVSDATAEVAKSQTGYDLGQIDWAVVDSSGEKDATVRQGRDVLDV